MGDRRSTLEILIGVEIATGECQCGEECTALIPFIHIGVSGTCVGFESGECPHCEHPNPVTVFRWVREGEDIEVIKEGMLKLRTYPPEEYHVVEHKWE